MPSVTVQKHIGSKKSCSFVAVNKWMVADNAISIGCGEIEDGRIIRIMRLLFRTGESRRQKCGVTNTGAAAMFGNLFVMDRQNHLIQKPAPAHLASSCSAFRYSDIP